MFYIMYLTSESIQPLGLSQVQVCQRHRLTGSLFLGLCTRRNWPEPQFELFRTRKGHGCVVRVNNREYSTGDTAYGTEELARNAAATQAYMICRNFSVNDGMMPGQRPGMAMASSSSSSSATDPVCQGLPVAIGAGRNRPRRPTVDSSSTTTGPPSSPPDAVGDYSSSEGSSAGGTSPRRLSQGDFALAAEVQHNPGARRYTDRRSSAAALCRCRRAHATSHGRCVHCLREAGYA